MFILFVRITLAGYDEDGGSNPLYGKLTKVCTRAGHVCLCIDYIAWNEMVTKEASREPSDG